MDFHPAANAFPMMTDERFAELKDDIASNGLLEPVTLCDGKILDGRNRAKACEELGIPIKTRDFGGDPWSFVWSLNGARRDLVDEQRYLIWKHCHEQSDEWQAEKQRIKDEANRKRSEAAKSPQKVVSGESNGTECSVTPEDCHPSRHAKAFSSNTNRGAVSRGDKLAKDRPDLAEKVRLGEIKPAEAHRQMKRDEVAETVSELPSEKFTVIYADPPWSYNDKQAGSISDSYGAAEKHYPSMSLSQLKAMDIPSIAATDAVLWLWATCPLLEDALELCRAWGFTYKAQFVWDKVRHNMGHYNSVRHELLLVCTRGSCTPQNVKLYDSVQSIERSKHSSKPEEFREIIDTIYPHGKRIELFRRGEAPDGWETWGNEAS